jgi:hypothetical protein
MPDWVWPWLRAMDSPAAPLPGYPRSRPRDDRPCDRIHMLADRCADDRRSSHRDPSFVGLRSSWGMPGPSFTFRRSTSTHAPVLQHLHPKTSRTSTDTSGPFQISVFYSDKFIAMAGFPTHRIERGPEAVLETLPRSKHFLFFECSVRLFI